MGTQNRTSQDLSDQVPGEVSPSVQTLVFHWFMCSQPPAFLGDSSPQYQDSLGVPPSAFIEHQRTGPHFHPPHHCCVINKTPQALAKPQQQNCPMRETADLISFPLSSPKSLPVIRGVGRSGYTQDRVLWGGQEGREKKNKESP